MPGPSPYEVVLDSDSIQSGETVHVTLRKMNDTAEDFKGFMVQARRLGTEEPIGEFVNIDG